MRLTAAVAIGESREGVVDDGECSQRAAVGEAEAEAAEGDDERRGGM